MDENELTQEIIAELREALRAMLQSPLDTETQRRALSLARMWEAHTTPLIFNLAGAIYDLKAAIFTARDLLVTHMEE